jgi:hypothetical protein
LLAHCHQLHMWSAAFQLSIWLMLLVVFASELHFVASVALSVLLLLIFVVGLLVMSSADDTSAVRLRSSLAVVGFLAVVFSSKYSLEINARVAFQHEGLKEQRFEVQYCTHALHSHTRYSTALMHCTHTLGTVLHSCTALMHCTHTLHSCTALTHCTHTLHSHYTRNEGAEAIPSDGKAGC